MSRTKTLCKYYTPADKLGIETFEMNGALYVTTHVKYLGLWPNAVA